MRKDRRAKVFAVAHENFNCTDLDSDLATEDCFNEPYNCLVSSIKANQLLSDLRHVVDALINRKFMAADSKKVEEHL